MSFWQQWEIVRCMISSCMRVWETTLITYIGFVCTWDYCETYVVWVCEFWNTNVSPHFVFVCTLSLWSVFCPLGNNPHSRLCICLHLRLLWDVCLHVFRKTNQLTSPLSLYLRMWFMRWLLSGFTIFGRQTLQLRFPLFSLMVYVMSAIWLYEF